MTVKKAKPAAGINTVPARLREARHEATKLLRDVQKRVTELLPPTSRRGLARLESRVEKARREMERRAQRALRQVEERARKALSTVEHRATTVARPLAARLDLASKGDVERLRKRIAELERRVERAAEARPAA